MSRGFTLVEVMVSLVLLAGLALMAARAFLVLMDVSGAAGRQATAAALAVGLLERTRAGPEAQATSEGWVREFDALAGGSGAFPAPHRDYTWEVVMDAVSVAPEAARPPWLSGSPPNANSLRWITVRVAFRGRALAQLSSAVIRDMHRHHTAGAGAGEP
jgi:prepilin-type N-terminal cleavage/methylation domain-containing protein